MPGLIGISQSEQFSREELDLVNLIAKIIVDKSFEEFYASDGTNAAEEILPEPVKRSNTEDSQ